MAACIMSRLYPISWIADGTSQDRKTSMIVVRHTSNQSRYRCGSLTLSAQHECSDSADQHSLNLDHYQEPVTILDVCFCILHTALGVRIFGFDIAARCLDAGVAISWDEMPP